MVRIVGFDLDDTLYSRIELYRDVFNSMQDNVIKTDVLFEDFYIMFQIKNEYEFALFVKKEKDSEQYKIDRVIATYKFFGFDLDDEQAKTFNSLYAEFREKITLRESAQNIMSYLKELGVPMFVLTNGSHESQEKKLINLSIEEFISKNNWFTSEKIGMAKPNKGVFSYIETKVGFTGSEIMYIGDDFRNDIVGPSDLGWETVYFKPPVGEVYQHKGKTIDNFDDIIEYFQR